MLPKLPLKSSSPARARGINRPRRNYSTASRVGSCYWPVSRLNPFMRGRAAFGNVVQSASPSFLRGWGTGSCRWLSGGRWRLVVQITLRKRGRKLAHAQAACRDVSRERSYPSNDSDSSISWEPIAKNPTPAQALVLAKTVECLLARFNEPQPEAGRLRLQGSTERE